MPRYKKNIDTTVKQFVLRVGRQGRIVIPAPMRRALGLKPGAKIIGKVIEENKVILSSEAPRAKVDIIEKMRDFAQKRGLDKMTLEDINQIIKKHRQEKPKYQLK